MAIAGVITSSFQSNIQENKDWNETPLDRCPRYLRLSEQHPREQGLKLGDPVGLLFIVSPFRATSKRTRIETDQAFCPAAPWSRLSEQHPREQGLKHARIPPDGGLITLSEQHPREQGLKLGNDLCKTAELDTFRATSKRTRIETGIWHYLRWWCALFQSNIQENKDWNSGAPGKPTDAGRSFRATSKRTRIETTGESINRTNVYPAFRATSKRTRIETHNIPRPC